MASVNTYKDRPSISQRNRYSIMNMASYSMRNIIRRKRAALLVVVIVLVVFQIISMFMPPYLFPDLGQLWQALVSIITVYSGAIGITLARFLISLICSIFAGWAIGLLMGTFKNTIGAFCNPLFSIMQAVPALSWVLLAVLWLSGSNARIFTISVLICMPMIAIAVYEGLRNIDAEIVEAVDQFRPTKLQMLRIVLIPQSVVYLIMSVRTVSAFLLRILIFAELVGATSGIGQQMKVAQTNFSLDMIFGWTVIMIVTSFIVLGVVNKLEQHLLRWRGEAIIR